MPASAAVHQVVSILERDDAVGNEVRLLREALRARRCESDIFVANRSGREDVDVRDLEELLDGPAPAAVLYHVATASRATPLLVGSSLPLVLVYHNVTPPRWFWGLDRAHHDACAAARRDVLALRGRVFAALGHSEFSRRELMSLGFVRTGAFPLLIAEEVAGGPGPAAPDRPMLLCVGRIAPNKCVEDVILMHHALRRHVVPDAELCIVGEAGRVPVYNDALRRLVARLDEIDSVHWLGAVRRDELLNLYRAGSVLVSMSEHEGFAGTLVEAMRAGTPVVAYAAGAVPETLAGAGILLTGKDLDRAAETVAMVMRDGELRRSLVARGRQRAAELSPARAVESLVAHLTAAGIELAA